MFKNRNRKFKKNNHYHDENSSDYIKIGLIVERVNSVEMKINHLICEYYVAKDKRRNFMDDFMFAGRIRLIDKLKIFKDILRRKNISFDEKSIENWIKIRNMVAHGLPSGQDSQMLFNGKFYNITAEFRDFEKYHQKMVRLLEECSKRI